MEEFDQEFLIGHGVPEAQAEAVLEAHAAALEAALAGTVPKEEVQRRIDAALEEAGADGEALQRLQAERDMLRTIGGEAFEGVKPKFREQVYALLDRGRRARPVAEQLEAIRERYEEYFVSAEPSERLPRFGGPTRGSMPRGALGAADQFSRAWGFGAAAKSMRG